MTLDSTRWRFSMKPATVCSVWPSEPVTSPTRTMATYTIALNRWSDVCSISTESASVSLIPEFSSVANCFVKSMIWLFPTLRRRREKVPRPSLEETSVSEAGWTLRIRNCLRAA